METHTNSDRTTAKDWAIAFAFLLFVAVIVPFIAEALPLDTALIVAAYLAIEITAATVIIGRTTQ
jgi:hypothetical protein